MRLNRSLYGLKQAFRSWHKHLVARLKTLGFEQSFADPCVFRMIEARSVSVIAEMHVDGIFAVGRKEICDRFCEDWANFSPSITLLSYDGTLVVAIPETWSRVY